MMTSAPPNTNGHMIRYKKGRTGPGRPRHLPPVFSRQYNMQPVQNYNVPAVANRRNFLQHLWVQRLRGKQTISQPSLPPLSNELKPSTWRSMNGHYYGDVTLSHWHATESVPEVRTDQEFSKALKTNTETFKRRHLRIPKLPASPRIPSPRCSKAFISTCHDPDDLSRKKDNVVQPILRFKHAVKTVIVLLKATKHSGRQLPDSRLLSFTQYQDEIARTRPSVFGQDLAFDPLEFKAHKEIHLSNEAKTILSMEPRVRTAEQLHVALLSLQQTAEAFSEFPVKMQKSLARVGWYEHFESKRVIIRQGHTAENFYLILSGTAVVTILESGGKSREPFMRTAALLRKGHSFGELALMHGATRSATVTCKEDVELLAVGRDDFIDIFMPVVNDKVPEHIRFLQEVDVLKGWPTDKLPRGKPQICLITYFRRGVVMCRDSSDDEWVYFIKSGSCSVLKSLTSTTPDIPGLQQQSYLPIMNSPTLRPRGLVCRAGRGHSNSSPYSSSNSHTSSTDLHRDLQVDLPSDLRRDPLLAEERITPNARSNKAPHPSHLPPIPRRPKQPVNVVIGEDRKVNNNTNSSPSNHRKVNNNTNSSPSNHRKVNSNTNSSPSNHSGNMADRSFQGHGHIGRKDKPGKTVFVKILSLGPKQTFGLDHVVFDDVEKATNVSLVSDGAEAVLINRKFFISHLTDDVKKTIRSAIQPYPSESSLQQKLQNETNWEAFKSMTVNDHIHFSKYVHDTLHL